MLLSLLDFGVHLLLFQPLHLSLLLVLHLNFSQLEVELLLILDRGLLHLRNGRWFWHSVKLLLVKLGLFLHFVDFGDLRFFKAFFPLLLLGKLLNFLSNDSELVGQRNLFVFVVLLAQLLLDHDVRHLLLLGEFLHFSD